jgi:hypothetical protein
LPMKAFVSLPARLRPHAMQLCNGLAVPPSRGGALYRVAGGLA